MRQPKILTKVLIGDRYLECLRLNSVFKTLKIVSTTSARRFSRFCMMKNLKHLIILSGLPGSGKTTLAKALAYKIQAMHIRIDTIEQAILGSSKNIKDIASTGYVVAYGIAEDNLKLGLTVIADSVNPIEITRQAWLKVAERTNALAVEIEVICSNLLEHKARIETRKADIKGHKLPDWKNVVEREYQFWNREHVIIDTSGKTIDHCVEEILTKL